MDVFGSVADLYETARPGYPPALADAIVAYHGGAPASVAEIGAGTGKGTEVLAALGAPTATEPPTDWMFHDVKAGGQFIDVQIERFQRTCR
jgi:hypothetical protein